MQNRPNAIALLPGTKKLLGPSYILAIKTVREHLGTGLAETVRGIEADSIEVPTYVGTDSVLKLVAALERMTPGVEALNSSSRLPSPRVSMKRPACSAPSWRTSRCPTKPVTRSTVP